MRMADKGWSKGRLLGRHVLGSNYFHYVRDPVGQLLGIFLRHRLHSQGRPLAGRRPQAGGLVLSLGTGSAARVHHQLRRRREPSHSTTIFTCSPGRTRSLGPRPLSDGAVELVIGGSPCGVPAARPCRARRHSDDLQMQRFDFGAFLQAHAAERCNQLTEAAVDLRRLVFLAAKISDRRRCRSARRTGGTTIARRMPSPSPPGSR